MKLGIVSGYFNPVHEGHLQYIRESKSQCDILLCIVNNDEQVKVKKSKKFLDENHRAKILQAFSDIDLVVLSIDKDSSVTKTLESLKNLLPFYDLIFFNSGDRNPKDKSSINSSEEKFCLENNIDFKFLDLPKIYSSRELLS